MTPAVMVVEATPDLDSSALVVCPSCHTEDTGTTMRELNAGGAWRCARCDQHWDAGRLATVARYDAWVSKRSASATPAPVTAVA